MEIKEKIGPLMVYSTIYDVDLPKKILKEMEEEQFHLDPEKIYSVDILFGTKVFERDEFYSFNLTRPKPAGPKRRKRQSEDEKKREKMYAILSEQLDNVVNALKSEGINIWESSIIGENYLTPSFVDVAFYLFEPEPKITGYCTAVMPSREAFYENLLKASERLIESRDRQLKEAETQQLERAQHTPNWFLAEELFSEIAQSLYPADYEMAMAHKERLYSTAVLVSDWPLQIKSKGTASKVTAIEKDSKLDCPEYMLYIQDTNGEWRIEKTIDLKTAQRTITKHRANLKRSDRIVVLHNLKAVPYTLFTETDEGLVPITPEEARGQQKLFLSWNK